jgi:hypothetical protein
MDTSVTVHSTHTPPTLFTTQNTQLTYAGKESTINLTHLQCVSRGLNPGPALVRGEFFTVSLSIPVFTVWFEYLTLTHYDSFMSPDRQSELNYHWRLPEHGPEIAIVLELNQCKVVTYILSGSRSFKTWSNYLWLKSDLLFEKTLYFPIQKNFVK